MAQGPESVGGVPLVVPVAAQVPVVALVVVEDAAGVVLELLRHLHGGDDCVTVKQDVLNVPLSVVVPGYYASLQDNFWFWLISASEDNKKENFKFSSITLPLSTRSPAICLLNASVQRHLKHLRSILIGP